MVMAVIIRKPSARRHVGRLLFEGEELRRRDGVVEVVVVEAVWEYSESFSCVLVCLYC